MLYSSHSSISTGSGASRKSGAIHIPIFKSSTMRKRFFVFWPILLLLGTAGCSITHVVRTENGERINIEQMIAEVSNSPLIFVGEYHDDMAQHDLQLEVIKGIHKAGKRQAIGIEMFETSSQPALDAWIAGKIPEEKFIGIYYANWRNLSWALYQDIFVFARDNGIPMVGLNVPRQTIEKVAHRGFSALSGAELRMLPPGSTAPISDGFIKLMTAYYPSHGKSGDSFRHLCEAQALRNRVMADAIIRYLKQHPGSSMVVLTGGGHAWGKGGIPAELNGLPHKIILPPFPGIDIDNPGPDSGADYLMD